MRFVPHFATAEVRCRGDGAPRACGQFRARCTQWGGRRGAVHNLGEGTARRPDPLWGAALRRGERERPALTRRGWRGDPSPAGEAETSRGIYFAPLYKSHIPHDARRRAAVTPNRRAETAPRRHLSICLSVCPSVRGASPIPAALRRPSLAPRSARRSPRGSGAPLFSSAPLRSPTCARGQSGAGLYLSSCRLSLCRRPGTRRRAAGGRRGRRAAPRGRAAAGPRRSTAPAGVPLAAAAGRRPGAPPPWRGAAGERRDGGGRARSLKRSPRRRPGGTVVSPPRRSAPSASPRGAAAAGQGRAGPGRALRGAGAVPRPRFFVRGARRSACNKGSGARRCAAAAAQGEEEEEEEEEEEKRGRGRKERAAHVTAAPSPGRGERGAAREGGEDGCGPSAGSSRSASPRAVGQRRGAEPLSLGGGVPAKPMARGRGRDL